MYCTRDPSVIRPCTEQSSVPTPCTKQWYVFSIVFCSPANITCRQRSSWKLISCGSSRCSISTALSVFERFANYTVFGKKTSDVVLKSALWPHGTLRPNFYGLGLGTCALASKVQTLALRVEVLVFIIFHHIWFWYLWCCGCPGLRGRQHLATPHTRSP